MTDYDARLRKAGCDVPQMTVEEAMARPADCIVFVDTRTFAERAESAIPGAMSTESFCKAADAGKFEGRDVIVVAYCTIGWRSSKWAHSYNTKHPDRTPVRNLSGSILAWTHAGGPLVSSDGSATKRVHVFASKWSLAHSDYTAVTFPAL